MFYAIGNVGDSKKSDDTRVNNANDPKEHVVEIMDADKPLCGFQTGKENNAICSVEEWTTGNTAYDILYSTEYVYDEEGAFESFGGTTFEFRYEMEDITEEQRELNINTWRDLYTFIVTSSDEEFYAHLKDYFVVDSALYFYLFTERYTMVDNRAKNSFWHYGKVYISNEDATTLGEKEASYYIIDDEAAAINDGYRYDLTFAYDMDTCLGIDNTGDYVFSYGKEDTDYYIDGDTSSQHVFRVADSVFFCRLRDLFPTELQIMFKDREGKGAWSSNSLITQWDNAQAQFPEELWRLDYQRKYYRPYLGLSIDNSIPRGADPGYLIGKFFGRKKYARRQFETNQEVYFATKYFGRKALDDVFWFRGITSPISGITPNYSLTLVPYSDMYVCVQYGSTGTPIHQKVKAGQTCFFENNATTMDFVYVYAASYIQEVGDLSRCYPGDNTFTSAIRLQKLIVGSGTPGYKNTFMKSISVANNPLLEHLDIRNISGIDTEINVSGCSNLKELYAEGTNATGVIFANGGLLETAHLPSIGSISMKNLNYIKNFVVEDYNNLHTLIVENTPKINTYNIINNAPNIRYVRLIGMNWDESYGIKNGDIFDRLLTIDGIDSSNHETDLSVLTGNAYITDMKENQFMNYSKAWSDLNFDYLNFIEQFPVTFLNEDGSILEVQWVTVGESAIDPTTREENPIIPEKESTDKYEYIFAGWDDVLTGIYSARTIVATFDSKIRSYTVKYVSRGITLQTTTAEYGSIVTYNGVIPTYTAEETSFTYYLFNRWDKSGYVNGDKIITAIFDQCKYSEGYFNDKELSTMKPVEIYALTKLSKIVNTPVKAIDIIDDLDEYSFKLGQDFDFDDIISEIVISEKQEFTGSNYFDTGIKLFEEDRDFVIAIDFKFLNECKDGGVIAECRQENGSNGFKLSYQTSGQNKGAVLTWGSNSSAITGIDQREIIVLRHKQGDSNLYVYSSNLDNDEISVVDLSSLRSPICNNTLVFGASKPEEHAYENNANGNIYWCKIWYQDLGEEICKQLASWTHEELKMQACGFNRYYLTENPNTRCTFSLLASHLLDRTRSFNSTNTNTGGWADSELNTYLNNRLYKALPIQIKALIKQVTVTSSIGDKSSEVSTSECYIVVPALIDVASEESTANTSPYINEGKAISFMYGSASRIRKHVEGNAASYWLRSPNVTGASGYYVYTIGANGATSGYGTPQTKLGILIEISF